MRRPIVMAGLRGEVHLAHEVGKVDAKRRERALVAARCSRSGSAFCAPTSPTSWAATTDSPSL